MAINGRKYGAVLERCTSHFGGLCIHTLSGAPPFTPTSVEAKGAEAPGLDQATFSEGHGVATGNNDMIQRAHLHQP